MKTLDDTIRDTTEGIDEMVNADNYDPVKRRYRSVFIPIGMFAGLMILVVFIGAFVGLPYMFSISYFAFAITLTAVSYNHWMLNSVAIPISVIFIPVAVFDLILENGYALIIHVPTAVCFFALLTRHNTSFIVMILTSFVTAGWIYTACFIVLDPYYSMILWMTNPILITLVALAGSVATSFGKTVISWYFIRFRGTTVDCDNGICPL